ncbi:MAG: histidine phosphatase family protein [Methylococcaceae bacterium]|nr:histidine phosphatase family protein [Methylococcaceae bacterium]
MSRELWLLRHAKAERYDGMEDFDRSLKKRGKRNAKRIGEWLIEQDLVPSLVISSPAVRAIMTAKILCETIGFDLDSIKLEKRLYDEGLSRVKSVLVDVPPSASTVLVVGHNPELEDLLSFLVKPAELPDTNKLLPTAALVRLALPDDWTQLSAHCSTLLSVTYPKLLDQEDNIAID